MVDTLAFRDEVLAGVGDLAKQPSDMQEHVLFLHQLVIGMRAKRVLEIGICKGVSTRTLMLAVALFDGQLVSIDKGPCEEAHAAIDHLALTGWWDHRKMWSRDIPEQIEGPFDLILIDGNHNYDFVKEDYENCLPLLREGGTLVLHDSNEKKHPGVKKFVGEIWDDWHNHITFPWGHGLTVLSGRLQ